MSYATFPTIDTIAQHSILRSDFNITVREASHLMDEKGCSSIVIESGDERYIFSVEDLLSHVHSGGNHEAPLNTLRIRPMDCLSGSERVLSAFELMEKSGYRYLGVLDAHAQLIGIVSYTDLISAIDPAVLMERKTIGELVSRTEPAMYTEDWFLEDVIHHFNKMEDAIIVVKARRPVGIISTKDVFKIVSSNADINQPLSRFMHSPVITTPNDATISDALMQLKKHNIKRAIVVDDDHRLLGVVTQSELIGIAYGSWINLLKNHTSELNELVEMLESKTKHLERQTFSDALTGLGNRRKLHQELATEMERIARYQSPSFSLVILDIDFFKRINDQHGHLIGDEILRHLAGLIRDTVRPSDCVIRWGGEEFAILLRNTSLAAAEQFAQRVRTTIEAHTFPHDLKLTISAGVGEHNGKESDHAIFSRVDRALYRAKTGGRNRVETDSIA